MEKRKAAIYCRIAEKPNQKMAQMAIDNQRCNLERYAEQKGLAIVARYEDTGYNGMNDERPGLQRLMRDAEAGIFDTLLVYKMDRLFRQSIPERKLPFKLISMLDGRNEHER